MTGFGNLLQNEIPRLRRYARALTRDATRADDLVQSCLVRALAKSHLWQPGTDLRAWLFTILHNQHVNDVRRAVREGINVPVEDVAPVLTRSQTEIPRLRRYARALTRDATRADDLVQSCLVRALAKSHLWQPGTDLRAWLFTILHNQHVNDVRRAVREGINVPVEDVAPVLT